MIGLLAYVIGLIALIPARTVLSEGANLKVGGTIWRGEAVLASFVHIDWTFAPVSSLMNLGYSADWHMTGGGSDLSGSVTSGGDVLQLDRVSGQADGTLLDALAPQLPIKCRFVADVDVEKIVLGGSAQRALGTMRTSPANCSARDIDAPPVDLPAMSAEVTPHGKNGTTGALMTAMRHEDLVELRLSRDGALSLWPTARAVQLAPFLAGRRYDTRID